MDNRSPHNLLEQLHWLRSLAHLLARDPHLAEDLVQDTVVAALSSKQHLPSSLRAWLGTTLHNVFWQRHRADSRRVRREQQTAETRENTAPSALDVASELSSYRRLLELVDALEEPYRNAIVRRFVRGESPAEIARALEIPKKTVYTRIDRGLTRLRRHLDDSVPGGRSAWCAAFLLSRAKTAPLALSIGAGSTLVKGITLMKTKLIAMAIAIASLLIVWQTSIGGLDVPVPVERDHAPLVASRDIEEFPEERQVVVLATSVQPSIDPAPETQLINGSVVDIDGHPVPNLELVFERSDGPDMVRDPGVEPVQSNHLGHFELPLPASRGRLRVVSPDWATARHPWLDSTVPTEPMIVVVAPKRSYSGRVVDEHGLPVTGARIDLDVPDAWGHKLEAMDHVVALPETIGFTYSDESGAFRFASVPFVDGTTLVALRDNYEPDSLELPEVSRDDLVLTLRLVSAPGLRGIVLDALDRPVHGALVSTGASAVETGPAGRFVVDPPRSRDGSIWALKPGHGAASLSFAEYPALLDGQVDLILRLPAEQLAIRGVLVDQDGTPVPGATVWTPDTTYFGEVMTVYRGAPTRGMNSIEGILGGVPTPARTVKTTTRADGTFELTGLTERSYALFALVEPTLAAAGPVYAEPGTDDLRLRLWAGNPLPLAGRVLSRSGVPLAGIEIRLGRDVPWERPIRAVDPWASSPVIPPQATLTMPEPVATTDGDGRFTVHPVYTDHAFLTFQGEAIFLAKPLKLSETPELSQIVARVDARSTFRLLVAEPGGADAFHLEGDDGRKQPLFMDVEQLTISTWKMALVDGRSGIGYSREGEVTVVLTRDDEEVRRVRVFLPAGGQHELVL